MVEDTTRRNPVSPQGSILWAEDDALARAMGRPEYSGRIRGTGLGPLLVRPTSRSSTSVSCLSQDAALVSRMNSMTVQMHELQLKKKMLGVLKLLQREVYKLMWNLRWHFLSFLIKNLN